jgi:hypothetical protein
VSNDRTTDGWGLGYILLVGLMQGAVVGAALVAIFLPRACGAEDAQALPPSLVVAIEGEETVAVVADYLDRALPPGTMWTTVGHGGMPLHPRTAARLKKQGLKPGIPDVLVVYQGRVIFLELKRPGGGHYCVALMCRLTLDDPEPGPGEAA